MKDLIQKILEAAVYAPSGDNSQPWHFVVHDEVIDIYNDPAKDNPMLNVNQRGSHIAHGALIENIVLLAGQHGYRAALELFPDPQTPTHVARVQLSPGASGEFSLAEHVTERATNRRRYDGVPLTEGERQELRNTAGEEGVEAVFIEDPQGIRQVSEAVSKGEQVMLEDPILHGLLFKDLRWSVSEEQKVKHGLLVKTLELAPPQEIVFRLLNNRFFGGLLQKLGIPAFIGRDNAKLYSASSLYGMLGVRDHSPATYVRVGRLMQRIWLTTTKLKLGFHPLTVILFLHQNITEGQKNFLSEQHRALVETSYGTIQKVSGIDRDIVMLFRVGHAAPPSYRCSRQKPNVQFT